MSANDLLDRYLYAVRRYLPAYHQDDLVAELSANLHSEMDDRQAELGRPLTEDEQVDVVRRQKDIGIDIPGDGEFGKAMGHKVMVRDAMGSANTIVRTPEGELEGASDLRQRGTLAVGY